MTCDRMPDFEAIREHKPAAFELVDWCRMFLGGAYCEPRRWLPNVVDECGRPSFAPLWAPADHLCKRANRSILAMGYTSSTYASEARFSQCRTVAGTCTPGVGPVCEVGGWRGSGFALTH